ncbi:probable aspartic proteinase precursor [Fusarium fujikuroi]|nr:probable aspartic proteinase precursor [Fusarium fujikuroi]SCV29620.1 probable aspartic proteinase precursor [Fusarium fujikuroi]
MKFSTVSFLLLAGCSTGIPHEIRGDVYEVKNPFSPNAVDPEVEGVKGLQKRAIDPRGDQALAARGDVYEVKNPFSPNAVDPEVEGVKGLQDRDIKPRDVSDNDPLMARGDIYEVKNPFSPNAVDPEVEGVKGLQKRDIDPEEQEEEELGKTLRGRAIDHENDPESAHLKPRAGGEKVKMDQLTNTRYKKPHAEIALIAAYNKYHKPLPPKLKKIAQHEAALINNKLGMKGTASATPPQYYDSQYVVPVKIGTPAQQTYLNFDTGSSDLWVFSTDTYQPDQAGHILYKPDKSSTSKRLNGQTWSIKYGDGTGASGIVGKTYVNKQAVESATEVSDGIAADKFSHGIMGLAMSSLNTVRPTAQKTYFQNVQDNLAVPVFTANLQKGKAGNYNFGYIDQSEYYGSIQFAKVKKDSPWWQLNIEGFRVAQGAPWHKYNYSAIVDTGTTLLLLPSYLVNFYYKKVKGAYVDQDYGVWVFPCSAKLPSFYFGFGSYRGKVPGNYINYGRLTTTVCYGGIQSSDGIGFAILGDILLKAQFVVFDLKGQRVGFANKLTVSS